MFVIHCAHRMKWSHLILCCLLNCIGQPAIAGLDGEQQNIPLARRLADSIKQLIIATPDDTLKVQRLIILSALQYEGTHDTGKVSALYAEQALALATKLKSGIHIAYANRAMGNVYQDRTEYQTAISYYKLALDQAEKISFDNTDQFYPPLLNLHFYLGD